MGYHSEQTLDFPVERWSGLIHVWINVIANVILLAAKAIATTQSSSLSLIASLLDSALDLLCTLIVWTTNKLVQWRLNSLQRRFPVGRRRLEPLGILVFSTASINYDQSRLYFANIGSLDHGHRISPNIERIY